MPYERRCLIVKKQKFLKKKAYQKPVIKSEIDKKQPPKNSLTFVPTGMIC